MGYKYHVWTLNVVDTVAKHNNTYTYKYTYTYTYSSTITYLHTLKIWSPTKFVFNNSMRDEEFQISVQAINKYFVYRMWYFSITCTYIVSIFSGDRRCEEWSVVCYLFYNWNVVVSKKTCKQRGFWFERWRML